MANTGVLPFVRGVDFTNNDFKEKFPEDVANMTGLRWLNVSRTGIEQLAPEIFCLQRLESLMASHNRLTELPESLARLELIRLLSVRHNRLVDSGIPADIFLNDDLSVLDFSYNELTMIPKDLDKAKHLLVLNLSNNQLTSVSSHLFINVNGITHLDVSNNKLDTLPPQLRRLTQLRTLILSNNPLVHAQLRMIPALTSLEILHMRNTSRTISNIPGNIYNLSNLQDLDIAENDLPRIPEVLYKLTSLKRLNASDNNIAELSSLIDNWKDLEYLNLSRNDLTSLPNNICKLTQLKKLYLNCNQIDFNGIPSGIGKLCNLEVFSASCNLLEIIPESICRCGKLKRLILNTNQLITLPAAIHHLQELQELDVEDNPNLEMPPKPKDGADLAFYNIDFSLEHQRQIAGVQVSNVHKDHVKKDPIARLKRLSRRTTDCEDNEKVLKGMQEVAKNKLSFMADIEEEQIIEHGKWQESLQKPDIDYSKLFNEDVGQIPGYYTWEIDCFLPRERDPVYFGKFYEEDCYIVLYTYINESQNFDYKIYFWIGAQAKLDKKAGAAIHAVHLRNFLDASCRISRQEMNDESDDFLEIFDNSVTYLEGSNANSGFFIVEETVFVNKLYRISGKIDLRVNSCSIDIDSLHHGFAYILDCNDTIYVWHGKKTSLSLQSKARLIAEKININERKNTSTILTVRYGQEPEQFWHHFDIEPPTGDYITEDFILPKEPKAILYIAGLGVGAGSGYLELPQVVFEGDLKQNLLNTKKVYILDCYTDVFIWVGENSTRLVRAAAQKLAYEICSMLSRPHYATVTRCLEGKESHIFKLQFCRWNDVIGVDYTRTSESVSRRGVDLKAILEKDKMKTDLSCLFADRPLPLSAIETEEYLEDLQLELFCRAAFVLQKNEIKPLDSSQKGIFYTKNCYIFIVEVLNSDDDDIDDEGSCDESDSEKTTELIVYFWEGRDSNQNDWARFSFGPKEKYFRNKEIVRMFQQRESVKFMSLFQRRFIIRNGSINDTQRSVQFYEIRSNASSIATTRCIQIDHSAANLNSSFCYILQVPFDSTDSNGIVYTWIGSKSNCEDALLAEQIADHIYSESHTIQILNEGEEPEHFFWVALGGKKPYSLEADFMLNTRLFRCSNDKGYFTVSEKCSDFCQDDLADDDVMILDNGVEVYFWIGTNTSDIEIKLAFKSAQVYIQHLKSKGETRRLLFTRKYKEQPNFKKCFHAWTKYQNIRIE